MDKININLSVVEVERKYSQDYEEVVYGNNSIVSYGSDNNMPVLLRNCYKSSATLKSVIDGMVSYILGDSVEVGETLALFKDKVNRSGMTMRQFIANLALDYLIYGGFAYQVINTKLGTVAELYPLDFARCRTNEFGTKVFYSKKAWTKWGNKAQEFEVYDRTKKQDTAIVYFKGNFTKNVYPLPTWNGALKDVLTEMECSKYSLNAVGNGFSSRWVMNIPSAQNLTKEQKEAIEEGIKTKFCGADANSNFMLHFCDSLDEKLEVIKLDVDDSAERFLAVKDNARTNIFIAFRATPNLFGLPSASTGFNSQEYSSAYKLFMKTVINPLQDDILCSIHKTLGVEEGITITPMLINFED